MKLVYNLEDLSYGKDYEEQFIAPGKYFITCHTGYAGSDLHEFVELTKPMSIVEWDESINQMALSNAESYGIYLDECEWEDEDDSAEYSYNIEGHAVNYNPDKHDGYSITGVPKFDQW